MVHTPIEKMVRLVPKTVFQQSHRNSRAFNQRRTRELRPMMSRIAFGPTVPDPPFGLHRCYSSAVTFQEAASPFSDGGGSKNPGKRKNFIPRKAAVKLTETARVFFKDLLKNKPEKDGVMLNYHQASNGEPRMVFSFSFVSKDDLSPMDEGVSLEVLDDGTPKSPKDSLNDGLPKLYVSQNAFMKVLGATVDINLEKVTPVLYDREGNTMDPNS